MTDKYTKQLRRVFAVLLTLTLLTFTPLTVNAEDSSPSECYMDETTLVLKGSLVKGAGSGTIVLPEGSNLYSVTKVKVDKSGAVFPANASGMFKAFPNLTDVDLSGADTGQVTDMSMMFSDCDKLASVSMSGVDTGSVTNMGGMFAHCDELKYVDLSGVDTSLVTNMNKMFWSCPLLVRIFAGSAWNADTATGEDMFAGCSALKGSSGTTFDDNNTDQFYARIDGGTESPGYLTGKYAVTVDDGVINGTVTAKYSFALPGTIVSLTVKPKDDYKIGSVSVNGKELPAPYNVYEFEMPAEDVKITANFTFSDGVGARLVGHTLSLDGDIGVNFYMELAPEIAASQTAYLLFTIPSGSETFSTKVYVNEQSDAAMPHAEKKGSYHVFKCNAAAKEMNSLIKAQIFDGDEHGLEYTYSVKDYADYLLDHVNDNEEFAKAAPLVRAMLTYGDYAKAHFSKTAADALADVEINAPETAFALPVGVSFAGATLSLRSETTLSLYFTSENNSPLTFTCNSKTVETVSSGGYQIARIRNIASAELQNSFTLKINGDYSAAYSPMNYCANVLALETTDDNRSLQNVVKSLYLYSAAANLYFNQLSE